jgi:flagellar hook-associated protein FlgK
MGDILAESLVGVRAAQSRIKNTQANIAKSQVVGAHRVDSESNYNGKTGGVEVTLKRAEDPLLERLFNQSTSAVGNASVIKDSLSFLQSTITDPQEKNSKLIGVVETFINTAKQLNNKPTASLKQNFIRHGENLAKTVSDTTNKILDLRLEADKDLKDSLLSVNNYISQLFSLNLSMTKGGNSNELLDQRDGLISKISEFFDIQVRFGINNNALVSTADGSLNLVDSTTYARFNYNNIIGREAFLQEQVVTDSITMDHLTHLGQVVANFKVVEGSDSSISKLEGGRVSGYIKLRDDILPKAGEAVKSLTSQIMNSVNAVHNKYSPFPPKTTNTSTKELRYNDYVDWKGTLSIVATTKNGRHLEGNTNSGAVRPISIDLSTLPSASPNGAATIKEMINEINAYLGQGLADHRLSLGAINETPIVGAAQDTYLVNNIKLAGMSDIDVNGNLSFDLELDGSKYFGSKVQVLSVTSPAGQAPNLPQTFDLALGAHTRTNQQITVGGIAGGPRDIDVQIRVIGDNGVVEEGIARFTVDPVANGNAMLNKRVVGTAQGGAIVATRSDTYAPIAVAKLVDENGVEIGVNSGLSGKLVIEAYNSDNGLIITSNQDDTLNGFNNFFGMNNFFQKDVLPGTIKVDESIIADPNLLSTGAPRTGQSTQTVAQGSGAPASATMVFGGAPQIADSITIQGVQLTFANPALTQNDIPIGGTQAISLTNLRNSINNHPKLSLLVTADLNLPLGDTLTITSKNLGISSNAIIVRADFNPFAGNTVDITPRGGAATGPGQVVNSTLGGGTNTNVQLPRFELNIGDEAADFFKEIEGLQNKLWDFEAIGSVPSTKNTIFGYASFITSLLSNQLSAARADSQIAENIKKDLGDKLQDKIGINKDELILNLSDYAQSLSALIAISGVVTRLIRDAIDTLKTA